jgi:hypothetical protein
MVPRFSNYLGLLKELNYFSGTKAVERGCSGLQVELPRRQKWQAMGPLSEGSRRWTRSASVKSQARGERACRRRSVPSRRIASLPLRLDARVARLQAGRAARKSNRSALRRMMIKRGCPQAAPFDSTHLLMTTRLRPVRPFSRRFSGAGRDGPGHVQRELRHRPTHLPDRSDADRARRA